jgi:hypothetical protein
VWRSVCALLSSGDAECAVHAAAMLRQWCGADPGTPSGTPAAAAHPAARHPTHLKHLSDAIERLVKQTHDEQRDHAAHRHTQRHLRAAITALQHTLGADKLKQLAPRVAGALAAFPS